MNRKNMNGLSLILVGLILFLTTACTESSSETARVIEDFNYDWKFYLGEPENAQKNEFDDSGWQTLRLPHDWSIENGYTQEASAASTGFVQGGIGWYRKSFNLTEADKGKVISVVFDGVYNNSSVWINGHFLGTRPYGYSTFSYNLTDHLNYDTPNIIAVKVDRNAYVDSRWYTGSGIYRKVQLVKTNPLHVAQWGVQITTPKVSESQATVHIKTKLENAGEAPDDNLKLRLSIVDKTNAVVAQKLVDVSGTNEETSADLQVENPQLWHLDSPNLYTLKVDVLQNESIIDNVSEVFGVRSFEFDANKGFFLNEKNVKIKGVNLHHDAGAVGAAVPKAIWEYRLDQLKSIGVNAIRMAHNPHAVELMEVCDEKGVLVMAEAFDEWFNPKGKSKAYLGDNAAKGEIARSYPESFNEWAERDLKDLIRRDFNHPSVIMWSIGNEIEWTFPHYSQTFAEVNKESSEQGYELVPDYNPEKIARILKDYHEGEEPLAKNG